MVRQPGAVRRTRGARAPHSGQADGSSHSAIARSCVNGPHFLHIYSYVGIDPPAETHPAADQSARDRGKLYRITPDCGRQLVVNAVKSNIGAGEGNRTLVISLEDS